jgi:uncharacterized membrane protein
MRDVLTAPAPQLQSIEPRKASYRVESIDLLRGLVMIIMALDHVRDYFHADSYIFDPADLSQTNGILFFTRWITHFCAPVFMFLAGTSAFLVGERKSKKQLSKFLVTRGLWLMLIELTVVNFGWFFNIHFSFLPLIVIWAIGLSMVVLSGLIYLPKKIILVIGLLIVFCHNLLDNIHVEGNGFPAFLWAELHEPHRFQIGDRIVATGYPVLAWIGVMALGYCFGGLYSQNLNAEKRKRLLLLIGSVAVLLFIIIRATNAYGDASLWSKQPTAFFTFLSFLNTTKYPPSLLYILMTLGPAIIFLSLTEKKLPRFTKPLIHIGRVPMFFYLVHIYVIHLLAMIVAELTGYHWSDFLLQRWPWLVPQLKGYGVSIGWTYIIWLTIIVMIYPFCKWYDGYKSTHKEKWWLSYL